MVTKNECGNLGNRAKSVSKGYEWQHTKNFFIWMDLFWGQAYFVSMYDDGHVFLERIKGKKPYTRFPDSWHTWKNNIKMETDRIEFEYPAWSVIRDCRQLYRSRLIVLAAILVLISMFFLYSAMYPSLEPIRDSLRCQVWLGIILLVSVIFVIFVMRRPIGFHRISISDEFLQIGFLNSSVRKFNVEDIKRCCFDINAYSNFIVFKDGTKLVHMERLSYWPILREYLLEKLEPDRENS